MSEKTVSEQNTLDQLLKENSDHLSGYELLTIELAKDAFKKWLQQKQKLERKHNTIEWLLEDLKK